MKEAMFYEKLEGDEVQRHLCAFNCKIQEGETGVCRVRKNVDGELYFLAYDKLSAANPDPIEKKPSYHFTPGTRAYSIATPGCNQRCKYCQNWKGRDRGEEDFSREDSSEC